MIKIQCGASTIVTVTFTVTAVVVVILDVNTCEQTMTQTQICTHTHIHTFTHIPYLSLRYFRQTKFTSFQRQLNLYGFKRLTVGRDHGGYYHPFFLRGRPDLCKRISRTRIKGNWIKPAPSSETEPNFYEMQFCVGSSIPSRASMRATPPIQRSSDQTMREVMFPSRQAFNTPAYSQPGSFTIASPSSAALLQNTQMMQVGFNSLPSGSLQIQVPEPTPIHPRGFISYPQNVASSDTSQHFITGSMPVEDQSEQKHDSASQSYGSSPNYAANQSFVASQEFVTSQSFAAAPPQNQQSSSSDEIDDDVILLLRAGAHLKKDERY
jgi:HSF-type DNA-binding